jgi:hypothetical protein
MVVKSVPETEEFSLVLGGPLYQLMLRSGLVKPPLGHLGFRIAIITLFAWLPLAVLSAIRGDFAHAVKVPFIYDFEVQTRFLFALPLMIVAELFVYLRMRAITAQFVEREIVTGKTRPAFDAVVSSATRLRNSIAAEIALLILVFAAGPFVWKAAVALRTDTWYANVSSPTHTYTPAGYWYTFASIPVFQFILLRWYWRVFIWCRFLFQVSRLDLNLVPIHPDRCCGLGFLSNVAMAFAPLLMAHSGLVAGFIANRIVHEGSALPNFRFELVGMAAVLLLIVLAPLCVFVPRINQARLAGLRTYGRLASEYVTGFSAKWIQANPAGETLLGTADIQSLADLDSSFSIIREMKLAPFGKENVIRFLVVIALPVSPLLFTMFSADELLKRVFNIIL